MPLFEIQKFYFFTAPQSLFPTYNNNHQHSKHLTKLCFGKPQYCTAHFLFKDSKQYVVSININILRSSDFFKNQVVPALNNHCNLRFSRMAFVRITHFLRRCCIFKLYKIVKLGETTLILFPFIT